VKIAFITNHEKTIFYHGVATRLEARGHQVVWIAPSTVWAAWLRDHGVADTAVLDLAKFGDEWTGREATTADRARLAAIEARAHLRINDVILMDRLLRIRPYETMLAYLAVCARELEPFVADVDIVFGEQTFGIEILTGMLCREYLVPYTVRVPAGRMGLFRGHDQRELARIADVTDEDRASARVFLETFRRDRPRPDYFARSDKPPLPRASWPAKLWKHVRLSVVDRHDETHFPPGWLVRQRSSEVLNALAHRAADPYWVPPQPPPRPYVLFPLHRQPEASIDVLGARFSNQLELVKTLARTLPATHDLYVKEHPNGRGDRTPEMLRELRAIPSVRLVDPKVSTFALAETADLTITISGTASYEAALLRRPAATIANMFYGAICVANELNPYVDSLADLLAHHTLVDDDRVVEFLANVFAQSFPGVIDNPLFTPRCLEPANLDGVAAGIARLVEAR
jgi:hypothetical protein